MKLGERANVVVGYYNRGDRGIVTSPHVIAPSAILEPARRCESARLRPAQFAIDFWKLPQVRRVSKHTRVSCFVFCPI